MVTKGYGFTVNDIDWSCPADLEPYEKAHNMQLREQDTFAHAICGKYVLSSLTVAIEHIFSKNAKTKYVDKPILQEAEDREYERKQDRKEYKGLTDEEKQKAELEKAKAYFNSLIARF